MSSLSVVRFIRFFISLLFFISSSSFATYDHDHKYHPSYSSNDQGHWSGYGFSKKYHPAKRHQHHHYYFGGHYNRAPMAYGKKVWVHQNESKSIRLHASDADSDKLHYYIVRSPRQGVLTGKAPNLVYTPRHGFHGWDRFKFKVSDGRKADWAWVKIYVKRQPQNTAPVANDQSLRLESNTTENIVLTGNDADGDALTYTVLNQPSHGSLSGSAPNFVYTPNSEYVGVDQFTFHVNDGKQDSNVASVSLRIEQPLTCKPQGATQLNYASFTDVSDLKLNGSAEFLTPNNDQTLRLTKGLSQGGSAFSKTAISLKDNQGFLASFSAAFSFQITKPIGISDADGQGADGLVFVLQTMANNVGANGGGIGYQGIKNSLGIEFDTWNNGYVDRHNGNHIGININGAMRSKHIKPTSQRFNDGAIRHVWVDYDGASQQLEIRLSDQEQRPDTALMVVNDIELPWVLGKEHAFVGFSSGTGAAGGQHDILGFQFVNRYAPIDGCNNNNVAPIAVDQTLQTNQNTPLSVMLEGSDADGDPLTYVIETQPNNGTLSGTAPDLIYTPNANYVGDDSFTFVVNDGTEDSAAATVSIQTLSVNSAPTANNQSLVVDEDAQTAITLTGTDPENDALSYTLLSQPSNGSLTGTAPNLSYVPNANFVDNDAFTFQVNDGTLDSAIATVDITVNPINDAPVANDQSVVTVEDTLIPIQLTGSDIDGDTLSFNLVTPALNGIVTGTAPNLIYTPAPNFSGADVLTFKVNDGTVDSEVATVSIVVTPVNDAPIADAQSIATDEDVAASITLTGSDPEGDALIYTIQTQPSNGVLSGTAPDLVYTPNANFTGNDSFTFVVNDGTVDSGVATVSITVNPVNDAPIADDQSITTDEDVAAAITLTGSDPEGDALTYTIETQPNNGTLTGSAPNLTYTPNVDFTGSDSFTFIVNDGTVDSEVATVSITVNPVNDAPIADDQIITTDEDVAATITLTGSDPEGDTLTYTVETQPNNGALTGSAPNLTYTPNVDFSGNDSFTFIVNDGALDSAIATIDITVNPVNDAPIANDQSITTDEDVAASITLTGSDPEGDTLTYAIQTQPTNGTLSGTAPDLTYTPTAGFNGNDLFTFIVNDGTVDSDVATVTITVNPVNDAPVADDQAVTTDEDVAANITLIGSDPEGDALTYAIETQPSNGILSGSAPNLTYTPNANFNGDDSFTFVVNDGVLNSEVATISITVNPINDAPVADDQSVTTDEDVAVNITLKGLDPEGNILSYVVQTQPANGTLLGTAPDLTYTPNANFTGSDSFTFVVNDGTVDSAVATVSITVNPVNDAPIADDQSITTDEDVAVAATLTGSDPDGDALTYAIQTQPSNGALSGTAPNLTYTPTAGFNGNDSFTFLVNDGAIDSSAATVSIVISSVNDAPIADDQSITTDENVAIAVTLTGFDPEGGALTYTVQTQPTNGVLSGTAPNLMYTPNAGFSGDDSFTFKVNDGSLDSNNALVNIEVISQGVPPKIISQPNRQSTVGIDYEYDVNVEQNSDQATFSLVDAPLGMGIDPVTGVIDWVTQEEYSSGLDSNNQYCKATATSTSSGNAAFADIAVIMDYSGSMSGEWEWVEDLIPSLEAGLLAEDIGTNTDNYYGLMETSYRDNGDRLLMDGQLLNTYDKFVPLANGYRGSSDEAGWEGINYVLDNYPLRANSARNFILVTDEPEQSEASFGYTYDSVLQSLLDEEVVLNAVLEIQIRCAASGDVAFGMDADGLGYVADGNGGYEFCDDASLVSPNSNIKERYVDLAFATGGAVWGISELRAGGLASVSFSRALQEIKVKEITEQLEDIELADLSIANISLVNEQINFDLKNRGLEQSSSGNLKIEGSIDGITWRTLNEIQFDSVAAGTSSPISVLLNDLTENDQFVRVSIEPSISSDECINTNHQTTLVKVLVKAENSIGQDTQTYWISTQSENNQPVITSTPDLSVSIDSQYFYQIELADDLGDDHVFSLASAPSRMAIDPYSGLLRWRPTVNQLGIAQVLIQVADIEGEVVTQEFELTVTNPTGATTDGPSFRDPVTTINFEPNTTVLTTPEVIANSALTLSYEVLTSTTQCALIAENSPTVSCSFESGLPLLRQVFLKVEDQFGRYALHLLVINRPPIISAAPKDLEILKAEKQKSYNYSASDPDGDSYSLQLVTVLEGQSEEGLRNFLWTAPANLIGQTVPVEIRIVDQYGAFATHEFEIQVIFNQAPSFTDNSEILAVEGRLYRYTPTTVDPDGDALTLELLSGPTDSMIQSNRRFEWDIPAGTLGSFPVELRVTDTSSEFDTQTYNLTVEENLAPQFTSDPITEVVAAHSYFYRLRAEDANGDSVTYSLIEAPSGMTLSRSSLLSWTPEPSQVGVARVVVRADDGFGKSSDQTFDVVVTANQAPEFTSTPDFFARVGDSYFYRVAATDPDGDSIIYSLSASPEGMTMSRTSSIRWTPVLSQLGEHEVVVMADDRNGAVTTQSFIVTVVENRAPVFTSTPVVSVLDSHSYFYRVAAQDPDNDSITYSLTTAPIGMTMSRTSSIRWTPTVDQIGVHDIVVLADDRKGGTAEQSYQILVTTNRAPEFTSNPIDNVIENHSYFYRVAATDPDGDSLIYSLESAPTGMTMSRTSSIRWTPDSSQIGIHDVSVVADDRFGKTTTQTFEVTVFENQAPEITVEPSSSGRIGTSYSSRITAVDPDGDSVQYRLVSGPIGLTMSGSSIRWASDDLILGTHEIVLEAFDQFEGVTEYRYDLTIIDADLAITKAPNDLTIFDNESFGFDVDAIHFEGRFVSYEFTDSPAGATISSNAGLIEWTPTVDQIGLHTFTVRAFASDGLEDTATFTITVEENTNQVPEITSSPNLSGKTNSEYLYQVVATDADGHTLTYSLEDAPSGMTVNSVSGLVEWFVPNRDTSAGNFDVTVRVTDERGKFVDQSYTLIVSLSNLPPNITSTAITVAKIGFDYLYTTVASDPNDDMLAYTLGIAPAGMQVNAMGVITWMPTEIGVFPVELSVTDGEFTDIQLFQVAVSSEQPTLEAIVTIDPPIVDADENVRVNVGALNFTGQARATILVDGNEVVTNRNVPFSWFVSSPDSGIHDVEVQISDTYESITTTDAFRVRDPGDATAPVAIITNITDDQTILAPIDVIGTVDDGNLASWQLILKEKNTPPTEFQVIAEGTENFTEQVMTTFDPTLVRNGQYAFILLAKDLNGLETQTSVSFMVDEDLKVGNFSVTFEDLNIPLAGIPISVRRTYDSRDRAKDQDFGFGWSLDYQNIKTEESRRPGFGWAQETSGGLIPNICIEPLGAPVVTITLPDGDVETFEAAASPRCSQLFAQNNVTIVFNAVGDTQSKLVALDGSAYYRDGNLTRDIADDEIANPDRYQLTTRAGFVYDLDQNLGIRSVVDPNGNTLTYSDEGIIHSDGKRVDFTRNAEGRIVKITDPSGKALDYAYEANGDLAGVTDRDGAETTFSYNLSHGLIDIMDPLGRNIVKNIYDDAGRLIAQEDNEGNRTEFNHDVDGRQSIITDRNGNTTQLFYDDEGNVTALVDALGNSTTYTHDINGNELSQINALGHETQATFNDRNDQLTQTDALGNVTVFEYNEKGSETKITDARGNEFNNTYDSNNNLASITDPLGNAAMNTVNRQGLPTQVTDVLGNSTQFTYDVDGYKTSETDAESNVITYINDDNGNVLTQTKTRLIAGASTEETTTFEYDDRDRVIKTIDALGNETQTEYDLVGNEVAQIDALGRRTEMEYDAYRRLLSTTYPDGTIMLKTYDPEGNLLTDTDRLGRVTTYEYDQLNRLIKTTQTDGSTTQTEYDAIGRVVAEVDANNNRTVHAYDAADRRISTTDALSNVTTFTYDADGNMISMRDANGNTTSYVYNALDQKVQTTFQNTSTMLEGLDALSRKTSMTDQAGVVTNYEYDKLGRLVKVIDALSQETSYTYDSVGNKLTQTDAEGRTTTWTYDALGRVISRTLPLGQVETMRYDEVGNLIEHIDFKGQTTVHTYDINDRLTQSMYTDGLIEAFVYDAMGNRTQANKTENSVITTTGYVYDNLNRLTSETQFVGTADETTLSYTYDAVGNRTVLTEVQGAATRITRYGFDTLNRLQTVTDPEANVTSYQYDAVGNRVGMEHANSNKVSYVYDELNRLTTLNHLDSADAITQGFTYTLHPTGRRTKITEQSGRVTDYTYDTLYRLLTESIVDPVNGNHDASYTYDKVGNRTFETVNGVSTAYTVDDNDRLVQQGGNLYTHDANGNTLTQTLDSVVTTYSYNAKNQLVGSNEAGNATAYLYNIDGIRIGKGDIAGQTLYTIDTNRSYAQVLAESTNGSVAVNYTYGDDLISQKRGAVINTYHYDGLGSTRALSDNSGALTDTYDYEAFGEVLNQTGTTENSYLFTGEQFDSTLDQYYLRARYYDQGIGRFTQMDTWQGTNSDPVTLHKYLYANVDPVNMTDPTGNFSIGGLSVSIGISVGLNTLPLVLNGGTIQDFGYAISLGILEGVAFHAVLVKAIKASKSLIPIGKSFILSRQISSVFRSTSNLGPLIPGFRHLAFQFTLSTKAGKFFISSGSGASGSNGVSGALKHLVGDLLKKSGNAITTEFAEAMVLTELKAAVEIAASSGIVYGRKMIVKTQGSTWELIFKEPTVPGQLPKLIHMLGK